MKYRAGWIVINSKTIIENAFLEIKDGKVIDFGPANTIKKNDYSDLGDGVITPTLINCHTHLELSPLKNKISFDNGFENWVKTLVSKRGKLTKKCLEAGIQKGIDELKNSGCFTTGEISSLFLSFKILSKNKMNGIYFKEYLGNNSDFKGIKSKQNLSLSYAGHAPHSTSPQLLKNLKKKTLREGLPFSIHTAESDAESEFILKGEGSWADFLKTRGIDYKSWPVKDKSPVRYLDELGILDENTICVHLINADKEDILILKNRKSKICLCPRSNLNLHRKKPDMEELINLGVDFCLGTDSLASVKSLSIFDEMKFICDNYRNINPSVLFDAATINGAKALNLEKSLGDLSAGKKGIFIYLDLKANNRKDIFERIIRSDFIKESTKSFGNTIV